MKPKNDDALKALKKIGSNGYKEKELYKIANFVSDNYEVLCQALEAQAVDVEGLKNELIKWMFPQGTSDGHDDGVRDGLEIAVQRLSENGHLRTTPERDINDGHDTLSIPMLLKQIEKLKQVEEVDLDEVKKDFDDLFFESHVFWKNGANTFFERLKKYAGKTIKIKSN